MTTGIDGKVALVTGAGTGLGRVTAQLFAQEGARVVVADIRRGEGEDTAETIRGDGGEAIFVETDVSSSADVQEMIAATEREYGALHVLTANAGMLGRGAGKTLAEIAEDEFREIMAVNFDGVWLSCKYGVPLMLRSGGGAITVTASLSAHRGYATLPAYCASKGACVALVRALAADLSPEIRVNAVSPGAMRTLVAQHTAEAKGVAEPKQVLSNREQTSGRVPDPIEVAKIHLFLASSDSAYVNGQVVVADDGRSILPA